MVMGAVSVYNYITRKESMPMFQTMISSMSVTVAMNGYLVNLIGMSGHNNKCRQVWGSIPHIASKSPS